MKKKTVVTRHALKRWKERIGKHPKNNITLCEYIRKKIDESICLPYRHGVQIGSKRGNNYKRYYKSRVSVSSQAIFIMNESRTRLITVLPISDEEIYSSLVWILTGHWLWDRDNSNIL